MIPVVGAMAIFVFSNMPKSYGVRLFVKYQRCVPYSLGAQNNYHLIGADITLNWCQHINAASNQSSTPLPLCGSASKRCIFRPAPYRALSA